jgi:hypothetical protein
MEHESPLPESVEYVSAQRLRAFFNEGNYMQRAADGQLKIVIRKDRHLSSPEAKGLPRCTLGQFIEYLDDQGQWHAQAYQYLKPDGSLGASGKPDPKRIRRGGAIWALERQNLPT